MVAQDPETQVVSTTVRGELAAAARDPRRAARCPSPGRRGGGAGAGDPAPPRPRRSTRCRAASSSGSRWRRRWSGRPRLVLLDEPTSQLDPVAGDELIGLLRRLNEEWGTGGGARRASPRALPDGRRSGAGNGRAAGSPSTARRSPSCTGRSSQRQRPRDAGGAAVRPGRACARRRLASSGPGATAAGARASLPPGTTPAPVRGARNGALAAGVVPPTSRSRSRDLWVELDARRRPHRRPARRRAGARAAASGSR